MPYKQSPFPMVQGTTSHKEATGSPLKIPVIVPAIIGAVVSLASAGLSRAAKNKTKLEQGQTAAMKGAEGEMTMAQGITEKKQGGIGSIGSST